MNRQTLFRMMSGSILTVAAIGLALNSQATLAAPETAATQVAPAASHGDSALPALEVKDGHAEKAGAAHAAEAGEHGDPAAKLIELNPVPFIFTILIFVVLVIVLRLTAWKPILAGLKEREESIRSSIEAAAKARADAERTTKELEAKMAEAARQGAVQLQQAKDDALKLADAIRKQAEAESVALKDRAMRDIEAAKQQALSDINGRAADLGISVARKILQRDMTVADQQKIVEESLAELGSAKI